MALRFFCYSFMRVREAAEIVEDIAAIVAASQRFERKSAMMLFVFVPTAALAEVLASVDRRYVKVAAQDVAPIWPWRVPSIAGSRWAKPTSGSPERWTHCSVPG